VARSDSDEQLIAPGFFFLMGGDMFLLAAARRKQGWSEWQILRHIAFVPLALKCPGGEGQKTSSMLARWCSVRRAWRRVFDNSSAAGQIGSVLSRSGAHFTFGADNPATASRSNNDTKSAYAD
jgi:hypothetical protein